MKWREQAELLLRKAEHDEYLLDKLLDDSNAPVEVFGFHAQQAVEKLLKALLASLQIRYPHTHRLIDLMDLITNAGIVIPSQLEDLRQLTPFAVEFRYDALPEEPEAPLEKVPVRQRIRDLRAWITSHLE